MSAELFWKILRRHETVCVAILRRLTGIVRASQRRVLEFSTLPVRSRLHAELVRMARATAPEGDSAVISPAPKHAELASRISTHREALTRELNELARAKLIGKRGNDLVIYDTATLESMVEASMDERDPRTAKARGRGMATGKLSYFGPIPAKIPPNPA